MNGFSGWGLLCRVQYHLEFLGGTRFWVAGVVYDFFFSSLLLSVSVGILVSSIVYLSLEFSLFLM